MEIGPYTYMYGQSDQRAILAILYRRVSLIYQQKLLNVRTDWSYTVHKCLKTLYCVINYTLYIARLIRKDRSAGLIRSCTVSL